MARQLKTYFFSRKPGSETNLAAFTIAAFSRKRARKMVSKEYSVNTKDYKVKRIKGEEILHHTYVRPGAIERQEEPLIS
jgi:hypothetical protein